MMMGPYNVAGRTAHIKRMHGLFANRHSGGYRRDRLHFDGANDIDI